MAKKTEKEQSYTCEAILGSKRFGKDAWLLSTILEPNKEYTEKQVQLALKANEGRKVV